MATGTAHNEPASAQPAPTRAKPDPAETLIDDRLRRARRQVKGVELTAGLVTLALGTLAYLLVATLFDHWVITGGFGIFGRLLLFAVLLIAGGAYCVWRIAPPLTRSVNPIFAASVLERCRPTLKNGLVNLLFLRQEKRRRGSTSDDRLARGVLLGLQRRTADDLARIPAETHLVDRAHIVRLAALLAAVVIACALYTVISPKSTMASFGRVIMPWAPIDAPTRVAIENVEPGDDVVLQGQSLTVRAEINGLRRDEPVLLYYTTADGRSVDQAVPMTLAQGDYRYQCQLPPGQSGFQQDLQYYLAAGDYRTPEYAITVETTLTIVVDQVTYDYPDYTGLEDETISNVGDLRAIEGSRVTLLARANRPIDWASLEMDCNSSRRKRMSIDGSTASASFELTMTAASPRRAEYESYQIRFAESETGTQRENRQPIRHRIEVIPDLPPEVRLLVEPSDEMIELPLSGQLDIGVFAEDPDFALRGVTLRIEHQGRSLNVPPLLDRPRPEPARQGAVEGSLPLRPRDFHLEPGDVLTYWAEAKDNKEPLANRSQTERRQITIVADRGGQSDNPAQGGGETSPQPPPDTPEETPRRPEEELTFDERRNEEQPQESPPEWDEPESESEEGSDEPQEDSPEDGESDESGESEASEDGGPGESSQNTGQGNAGADATGDQESQEQGESSTSPDAQPGQRSRPIDEANPGEAFEEIAQYLKEQEEQEGESRRPSASDASTPEGDPSAPQEAEEGENTGSPESPDDSTSENTSPQQQPGDAAEAQPDDAESSSSSDGGSEESAAPEDGEQPEGEGSASAASEDQEGGAGAGTPSEGPQPTPAPQGANEPDEELTPSDSDQGDPSQDDSPPSPSISEDESDPQPRESEQGDLSGAGDEGGGQDSDQEGEGTPGSSTPSDEGASQADESGEGEPGDVPGAEAESDHPTGTSDPDQRPGPGSGQGPSQGVDPGENPQESSDPSTADAHSNTDSQTGAESNSDSPPLDPGQVDSMGGEPGDPGSQGQPQRGSSPGTGPDAQGPTDAGGPEGDAPDEDFARQTVDFVLEKLEDQLAQPEPDQELLDRLQWTREDLARFVDQWKAMKAAAGRGDYASEAAREDLDEAIKSLGLRPSGGSVSRGGLEENATPNVDARRFDPPPRWSGFRELSRGSR